MSIKDIGKRLCQRYPSAIDVMSTLYNATIGLNKRSIKGNANRIQGQSFLRRSSIVIVGNNNAIDLGDTCYLNRCSIFINGNNCSIKLGKRCVLEAVEFWIEDDGSCVEIRDNTLIHGKTHLAATEGKTICIGRDCMFSEDVVIRTGDSHSIVDRISRARMNHAIDVSIGNHVWMGNKTIVLKGALVPDNTIVATGAIVTKAHEGGNVILAGNPARVVKEDIDWVRQRS